MKDFRIACSRGASEASPPACNFFGDFYLYLNIIIQYIHVIAQCPQLELLVFCCRYILNLEANTCKISCTWVQLSSSDICTMHAHVKGCRD